MASPDQKISSWVRNMGLKDFYAILIYSSFLNSL
jgi:hypothetical protein